MGHELRRPEADFLRDGIYELRVSRRGVHHASSTFPRVGRGGGLARPGERAPPKEIDRATERKKRFEANPLRHTYEEV
jgi:hypothetical protein